MQIVSLRRTAPTHPLLTRIVHTRPKNDVVFVCATPPENIRRKFSDTYAGAVVNRSDERRNFARATPLFFYLGFLKGSAVTRAVGRC